MLTYVAHCLVPLLCCLLLRNWDISAIYESPEKNGVGIGGRAAFWHLGEGEMEA